MNRVFAWLATAALAMACALPAHAERESPPPPSPPQPFVLADLQNVELPNGLAITFIPFGTVPKVTISAVVRTGALNQGGKIWLSSLATELMKEGTQQRNAGQIAESAALMGGALSAQAGDDETSFGLDVLSESAPDAVKLLAEVMMQPSLPESELARLKQDFQRTLSVQLSSPQTLADVAFSKLIYPHHPYGDDERADPADLHAARGHAEVDAAGRWVRVRMNSTGRIGRLNISRTDTPDLLISDKAYGSPRICGWLSTGQPANSRAMAAARRLVFSPKAADRRKEHQTGNQ